MKKKSKNSEKEELKKVYIILSHTGTVLSRVIKTYTKDEYSHVSIALDENLNEMYSFGRLNAYNPFWGGFVHESINYGTFKRFKNTYSAVYSIEVTKKQFDDMKTIIKSFNRRKSMYGFNALGLFAVPFHIRVNRRNAFYCAEFVKYVMESAHVKVDVPEIIKPEDFKDLNNSKLEYKGKLSEYTLNLQHSV